MIQALPFSDPAGWDSLLLQLPAPHPLQSSAWADHKAAYGWSPQRWVYREDGRLRGAALVLRRRVSRLPVGILYVPKGPLLDDWGDAPLVDAVLAHLETLARRQWAIFVKIDPDVDYRDADYGLDPALSAPHGDAVAAALARRSWRFSDDQIQYRNTVLLDLRPDEATLLAQMKPKTRYNIGLAARKGVTVRAGGAEDLPAFFQLYAKTGARDGFLTRDYAYYRSAWQRFLDAGLGCLLLADAEGRPIAGVFLFCFGRRAWYIYGASASDGRERMPNHLLQWEAIRWARTQGCTAYDWWGAPDELSESDPMWGVYRFKAGFGGGLLRHIGAWDYASSRRLYALYAVLIPRYLALLRGRRSERND